ncbi:MAG: DeoR family transcriptional regulator [Bacteroidetes bacterium]|nr:DeoR family transcriptional regulator [Bacteroidota bacterium]
MAVPNKVLEHVKKEGMISIDDLVDEFQISRTTAMNYLSRLSNLGVIYRIGYGLYEYGTKNEISLPITLETRKIINLLRNKFGEKNLTIWSLSMLENYTHYAIGRDLIFVEIKKALEKSIRDVLIQNNYQVVIDPNNRDYYDFSLTNKELVFIIKRKEEYGTDYKDGLIPFPERMWADLYYYVTRNNLSFSLYELGTILGNMIESNIVNYDRLLYYSNRRKMRDEIVIILYEILKNTYKDSLSTVLFKGKNTIEKINEIIKGVSE